MRNASVNLLWMGADPSLWPEVRLVELNKMLERFPQIEFWNFELVSGVRAGIEKLLSQEKRAETDDLKEMLSEVNRKSVPEDSGITAEASHGGSLPLPLSPVQPSDLQHKSMLPILLGAVVIGVLPALMCAVGFRLRGKGTECGE